LIVSDAERAYIALFNLIAVYDRHPQALPKPFGKSGFSLSLLAREDDALWFNVRSSACQTIKLSGAEYRASKLNVMTYYTSRGEICALTPF
jgi:hypothetical protein